MISSSLRVFLTIGLMLYFLLIFSLLKRKTLSLRYTLLWIFGGIGMAVLIIFPEILNWFSHIAGIKLASNGLFAVTLFFVLIILISITSIVSKQSENIKRLVQDNALLEKRIRELEDHIQAEGSVQTESSIRMEDGVGTEDSVQTESSIRTGDGVGTEDSVQTESSIRTEDGVGTEGSVWTEDNIRMKDSIRIKEDTPSQKTDI